MKGYILANRLQHEKSPYLLQHKDNPVDWYPWGDEAFEIAAREDKPVLVSIGYSTCHWCHVMAHESFEDERVAAMINESFIAIKVDREERPDIDDIYMNFCQMTTGSGGWPLTVVLTPDRLPFFVGTYFPRESRYGRRGMTEFIPLLANLWKNERDNINETGQKVHEQLQMLDIDLSGGLPEKDILDKAYQDISSGFDTEHGGFSPAPKFPMPHIPLLMLRLWKRDGRGEALAMVERTLRAMHGGGLFDHLGGGFHRYSTDDYWLVPHFEKMLYDQALIALLFVQTYQATGDDYYAGVAREVYDYVLRVLTSREGGFYCGEDADSEGAEGKFYLWSESEISFILDQNEASVLKDYFNISPEGNFLDEATQSRTGDNILYPGAGDVGLDDDGRKLLDSAKTKLFEVREKRAHPSLDNKILADWNCMMACSLAVAGRALDEPRYLEAAKKSVNFVLNNMLSEKGRLLHRWADGETAIPAFLDDYAWLVRSFIELYASTFDPEWLEKALRFNNELDSLFRDSGSGGYYFSSEDSEIITVRRKIFYDGAVPSGNSVAALNLVHLARLTGSTLLEQRCREQVSAFSEALLKTPSGAAFMLGALDFLLGPSNEVVVAGERGEPLVEKVLQKLRSGYFPSVAVILKSGDNSDKLKQLAPFCAEMKRGENEPLVYVCRNFACNLPTSDMNKIFELLG